jgi:Fur family peroxide stress response transcriptional regulator
MKTTRNTQQKKIIKDALTCLDHPTASELYESIHKDYPAISKATVFRVLSQYADNGDVLRLTLFDSSTRFDYNTKPHVHAHCSVCGRVFDVWNDEFNSLLNIKSVEGFEVTLCNIELNGICKDCKNKK